MASLGESVRDVFGISKGQSEALHDLFGGAADKARASVRGEVARRVEASDEGQRIKTAYVSDLWDRYGVQTLSAVIAGLILYILIRR